MGNPEDQIATATRHVAEGRRIVEQQRMLIAEGRGGPEAFALLKTFERSQEIFEVDLDRLLRERGGNRNLRNVR
jgi:hypothetical protein